MDPREQEQADALAAPFEPRELKWKAQAVKDKRALAVAYVDARVVQDRLDDVVGTAGWQDEYQTLPDGSVTCRLTVRLAGAWVTKMDVGSPSEQPDEGDRVKAAFSDALKRAAVKFGIGRYLYRLPHQWVDYDPGKKQLARTPALPASALPKPAARAAHPAPAPPLEGDGGRENPYRQAPMVPRAGEPTVTTEQLAEMKRLREFIGWRPEDLREHVAPYGTDDPRDLTRAHATVVIEFLREQATLKEAAAAGA